MPSSAKMPPPRAPTRLRNLAFGWPECYEVLTSTDLSGHAPADPSLPAYNIIVVPGNPGLPGFYSNFVNELVPLLPAGARWRVSVVGLRGHVSHEGRQTVGSNPLS